MADSPAHASWAVGMISDEGRRKPNVPVSLSSTLTLYLMPAAPAAQSMEVPGAGSIPT